MLPVDVHVKRTAICLTALAVAAAGCGGSSKDDDSAAPAPTSAAPVPTSTTMVRPTAWSDVIDNQWFPLIPGTTFHLRGSEDEDTLRETLVVTDETKVVDGVTCTVLHDNLYVNGVLEERTTDWYAQDAAGNVWYFGEDTVILDKNGKVKTHEGSWESGVDGAEAGVFMPAEPAVGQSFRQEYYKGQAEDHFRVVDLAASLSVPGAHSDQAMRTEEWTPLEPDVLDNKWYVRGVGTVKEQTVKGGTESLELVSVTHA